MTEESQRNRTEETPVHSPPKELEKALLPTLAQADETDIPGGIKADESDHSNTRSSNEARGFVYRIHSHLREDIALADQKVVVVIAIAATLTGFLYTKGVTKPLLESPTAWTASDCIGLVAMLLLLISIAGAVAVVFPRFRGSGRGFVSWKAISSCENREEFNVAIRRLSEEQCDWELAAHSFELALICKRKFVMLRRSMIIGLFGAALLLLYIILKPPQG